MTEFICRRERCEGGWVGRWPQAQAAQFTHNAATRRLTTFNGFLNGERGYGGEWCFSANVVCLRARGAVQGITAIGTRKKQFCSKTRLLQKGTNTRI